MSHSVQITLIADADIKIGKRPVYIHDIVSICLDENGTIIQYYLDSEGWVDVKDEGNIADNRLHEGKTKKGGVNDPPKTDKPTMPPPHQCPIVENKPTYDELVEALEEMALQYLTDVTDQYMTHSFMQAGEHCLDILKRLGKVKGADKIAYTWIEPPF